jgi:metallo-beta-lactamase class B
MILVIRKLLWSFVILFIFNTAEAEDSIRWISQTIGIAQISPNVYLIKSYVDTKHSIDANHLLIVDNQDIVLINTPWTDSCTHFLLSWIDKEFKRPVTKVIITHSHVDCAGGSTEVRKSGIITYSLDQTKKMMEADSVNITITFRDSLIIDLQKYHLNLFYFGGGHTLDNIVVWIPGMDILYGGCLIKCNSSVNLGNIKDADLKAWPVTIQRIKKKFNNARVIVPGHGEYGDTRLLSHTLELLPR